jgi:hypothetical protein
VLFCQLGLGRAALEQLFYPLLSDREECRPSFHRLVKDAAIKWKKDWFSGSQELQRLPCLIRSLPVTYRISLDAKLRETYDKEMLEDSSIARFPDTTWTLMDLGRPRDDHLAKSDVVHDKQSHLAYVRPLPVYRLPTSDPSPRKARAAHHLTDDMYAEADSSPHRLPGPHAPDLDKFWKDVTEMSTVTLSNLPSCDPYEDAQSVGVLPQLKGIWRKTRRWLKVISRPIRA